VIQDYDWRSLIAYAKDHGGYKGCSYQIETDSEIDEYDFFNLLQFIFSLERKFFLNVLLFTKLLLR